MGEKSLNLLFKGDMMTVNYECNLCGVPILINEDGSGVNLGGDLDDRNTDQRPLEYSRINDSGRHICNRCKREIYRLECGA